MNTIEIRREKKNLGHNSAYVLIKKAVNMVLKAEGIQENCIVSVLLTDDEGIQEKNREFRNVDSATDVLSFPLNELTPGEFRVEDCAETDPETEDIYLGDIMINLKRCEEQGAEFGHGFDREIMYLTVHSMLHLLGYDHVDEGEMKKQMRAREKAIMGDD
ncbi:MAG: rRNA maturation RNase YbeY [Eubacteriales bacterium]|nr:rRNA maturation RNase YbeY [Eubacteriales bacterium]